MKVTYFLLYIVHIAVSIAYSEQADKLWSISQSIISISSKNYFPNEMLPQDSEEEIISIQISTSVEVPYSLVGQNPNRSELGTDPISFSSRASPLSLVFGLLILTII